jgi:hypothetical protein
MEAVMAAARLPQAQPRKGFARQALTAKRRAILIALIMLATGVVPFVGIQSAQAATYRCPAFVTWQDWVGGARVHAYVDFHPSDICNGRHVKDAYVHLIRQCGPYYDPGRDYTYTASSPSDTRLYSVSSWIFDSVLWYCNTNAYYSYDYF